MVNRKSLDQTNSFKKLTELSRNPFDLRCLEQQPAQDHLDKYICSSSGFDLYYGTQRLDNSVLDCLQELADELELIDQFVDMRQGSVINQINGFDSENRQVLHTACRDIFSDQPRQAAAASQAAAEMDKLKTFLAELDNGSLVNEQGKSFDTMIHVGIGGSDLGPRSIYEALRSYGLKGRRVFFISNVDPDDAARVLDGVHLPTTLVNIVSKSGSTLETLTNETLVRQAFLDEGLAPNCHFISVTGQGSPMDNPDDYLRSFYMYDYIGGRYSSTSMVGAVMLGFGLGFGNMLDFLRGAHLADNNAEERDIRKNVPLLMALLGIWNHNFLQLSTLAVLPYSQALHRFSAHLQQCDMESNGKSLMRNGQSVAYQTGPILWGEPGTNGQHAFYQLLHQGTEIVAVEFIGFRQSQYGRDIRVENTSSQQKLVANLLAQSLALAIGQENDNPNKVFPGNRPNSNLMADRLTPESMGKLLAIYEAKIVFQGFVWNINSFDQEGVQLGKRLATIFLANMKGDPVDGESIEARMLRVTGTGSTD